MAENLGTKVIETIADEIWKDISTMVKRQLNYLCCFTKNIKSMQKEAESLEYARVELQRKIDVAWRNQDEIIPTVKAWLRDTDEIQAKIKNEIEAKIPNLESGCWTKIKSPFSLGKKVKVTTEVMEKLRKKVSEFDAIFHTVPTPAMLPYPPGSPLEFDSRKEIEDQIVKVLNEEEVNVVGIHGMGGVGKTTLAEKILCRVQTDGSFAGVVKVEVNPDVDLPKIQNVIFDSLDFNDEEKNLKELEVRARLLFSKLRGPKKLLILLDDIWEAFKLEKLGIPREGGCTTLITSRDKDVLKEMCDKNIFEIQTLLEDEAQSMFTEKAGIHMDDTNLGSTAKEIVDECKGLPLAIVTIGSALKDKEKTNWDDALSQLKSSLHDKKVYTSLFVSYNLLPDPNTKLLFLLCCLFPEDHHVSLGDLALYAMGLGMFKRCHHSLKDVRREVRRGIQKLKDCSLLLDGNNKNEVKMHDVVRDVAIEIATEKEGLIDGDTRPKGQDKKCKWISVFTTPSNEPLDHLVRFNFPELHLLIIQNLSNYWSDNVLEINDISFLKRMQNLNTLSFKKVKFRSTAKEIEWPKNLSTLQLVHCNDLKTLSLVGDLRNLEILDCNLCKGIEELPIEIGQLKYLKLLNLSGCTRLKRIAPGIIKQLVELEELKMLKSFTGWESSKVNNKEGMNVPLNELESLHKLTCLKIQIDDISLAHEKITLSPNLVKYKIMISNSLFVEFDYEKATCLSKFPSEIFNDGSWIWQPIATTRVEKLELDGDGLGNWVNLSQTRNNLKELRIARCGMLKELVESSTISVDLRGEGVFPMLECLMLEDLLNLKQVCDGQNLEESIYFQNLRELDLKQLPSLIHFLNSVPNLQVPFNNLRKVRINKCGKLLNLFSLEMAKDAFIQLETLEIEDCETMEQVFISNESTEDIMTSGMTFPKLKRLELVRLPNMKCFWKGSESIGFPSLKILEVNRCEEMKSIVCNERESEQNNCAIAKASDDDQTLHLFCGAHKDKVKFGGLKNLILSNNNKSNILCPQIPENFFQVLERLSIERCHNIRNLFSISMVENLVNLNYLHIEDCDGVEEVLRKEINKNEGKPSNVTFPKLKALSLEELPSLTNIGKGIESIKFPMLEELKISSCPWLKSIVCGRWESNEENEEGCINDDKSFHCLCDDKVKFNKLIKICIIGCHAISSVFSSTALENLTALETIEIWNCSHIKKVIRVENEIHENTVLIPNFKTLHFKDMPLLEMLCEWKYPLEFSLLKEITVVGCPQLKFLTSGSLTTPKLNNIDLDNRIYEEEWNVMKDLNSFLCQYITATREVWTLDVNISEPSQLNRLWLSHHLLPPTNALRLLYIISRNGIALLAITSNAYPHMWYWMHDKATSYLYPSYCEPKLPSGEPKLRQHDKATFYMPPYEPKLWQHDKATSYMYPYYSYGEPKLPSGEPKLRQLTDNNLMPSGLNNEAKSTQDNSIACISMSNSDHYLVSASGGAASLLDVDADFKVQKIFMGPPPVVTCLAFHPVDNNVIVIGMDDSTIQIYYWNMGEVKATLKDGHQKRISGLAFSKSLKILVSSGADAKLCMWSINGWEKKKSHLIQVPPIEGETRLQFHADQYHLLVVHHSQIAIYDPQLKCLCMWCPKDSLSSPISCAMYSCDGRVIYTGFNDGAIGIFNFKSLTLQCRIAPSAYISSPIPSDGNAFPKVIDIAVHPYDPNKFALGTSDGAVCVIEPPNMETKFGGWKSGMINAEPACNIQ